MLDLNWLTVLIGTVLPMLVALVTARLAHPGLKAVTLAVLAAVGGLASELYSVGGDLAVYDWSAGLANAVVVFLVGVGAHYGLLKPAGVTGSSGGIASAVTGGIGTPSVTNAGEHRA